MKISTVFLKSVIISLLPVTFGFGKIDRVRYHGQNLYSLDYCSEVLGEGELA